MARQKPSDRTKARGVQAPKAVAPDTLIIQRGPTNIKPPTKAEIQRMKNRELMRKHPTTSV